LRAALEAGLRYRGARSALYALISHARSDDAGLSHRWKNAMPEQESGLEDAATAAATKPETDRSTHAIDYQQTIKSAEKKQAIADLRRDFVIEVLRIAAVKAAHAADDIEIGDDIAVERGISIVIAHVKEAAAAFREMQREVGL
jgi:hypothetical protein